MDSSILTPTERSIISKLEQDIPIAIIKIRTKLPRDYILSVYRKWCLTHPIKKKGE